MVNEYIKNGFAILDNPYDKEYIKTLKNEINSLFKDDEETSLSVGGINNEVIFKKILNILTQAFHCFQIFT